MEHSLSDRERRRVEVQAVLDAAKTQAERNRLGQFATPPPLASEIVSYARKLLGEKERIRFLDPAFGTGSFYSALLQLFSTGQIASAMGHEIDRAYFDAAIDIWAGTPLDLGFSDFTKAVPSKRQIDLLICNPPYVRHHHIIGDEKARIQAATAKSCGLQFNGLAGLYCHFVGLSHAWMAERGIAGWLIPSEFMDVNYGATLKRYLLDKVRLLHIHRFDPYEVQFCDALVSSAVVWFRKEVPPHDYEVRFSYGGTLSNPNQSRMISSTILRAARKWTRFPEQDADPIGAAPVLSDFFKISRGLATGDNRYFILDARQIAERNLPPDFFKPILPSPRHLRITEISSDEEGNPLLDKPLFLLDCRLPEAQVEKRYPALWRYLQEGLERGVSARYLCQHRSPWYAQENRPPAPFLCTYLARGNVRTGRPFRFILNRSRATMTNVYLALYPKYALANALRRNPASARRVWEALNQISPHSMLAEGRFYGGGLHKLEPKELANVPVPALAEIVPEAVNSTRSGRLLF